MNAETVSVSVDVEENLDWNHEDAVAWIKMICAAANEPNAEVSVTIINDEEMKRLNYQYRGLDKPTDVLSFSMRENGIHGNVNMLGDIVISYDTAIRQAEEFGHTIQIEINELLFHGMLHLFGYDHETNRDEWINHEQLLIQTLKKMNSAYIPLGLNLEQSST